jgi:alkanesulfonate monooxygenase SsuD/methylene tetrahydromethanopterin reductase-like flavin-dependent oxidoreductase (luciferase family)
MRLPDGRRGSSGGMRASRGALLEQMSDYGRPLEFGLSVVPAATDLEDARALAARADALGLDLLGIQDHPYQWRFLETWMLMADLLARTERLRIFPDVANLPLRLPAMLAKQAASLDALSGGRFELGLGAGAFWEAISAMGGPVRSPREALEAHEEAIRIIRLFWSGERTISFQGRHYSVSGVHPGAPPPHPIGIWLGVLKPRALALAGRLADGWVPSLSYAPPEVVPEMQRRIDEAAAEAGRPPAEIRRVYNVSGEITGAPAGAELLHGPVDHWIETLTGFALELGFDTFVFWPRGDPSTQVDRFAKEIVPGVREAVERARRRTAA